MGSGGDVPAPLRGLVDDALARWQSGPRPADDEAGILAEAIAAREVAPVYQPIVTLPDGETVAVEALVRIPTCRDPRLGSAVDIIAVAERSGLIVPLGLDVLGRACVEVRRWRQRAATADLQIHVNVSPLQLRDDRFIDTVGRTLALASLPASALVLEITETAAFEGDGRAEAVLLALAGIGVELAVDDFGTGFASLEVLAATPARSIKLDRSFVASVGDLDEPPRGRAAVVQAAIGLGRSLGLRIVAEGIEQPSQARTLTAWGCEFGQGYLYGRPAPADEVAFTPVHVLEDGTPDAGRVHLAPGTVDLATSAAIVLATGDPEAGTRRADAMELAIWLAEQAGLDRRGADVTALLASIGDATERLPGVIDPASGLHASAELAAALVAPPQLGEHPGAARSAAAAWHLAGARRDGADLDTCLRELGADLDGATARRVADWWHRATTSPAPLDELTAIERRLRSRGDSGRRLRSLTALTRAIGTPGSLTDVLEVTAEEARSAIGAASLSISRFEPEHGHLRTLVNVGELAEWEERRPTDETYLLDEYPQGASRLLDGVVHWLATADGEADAAESELLRRLGKGSSVAVPIVVGGAAWGEVYATTGVGAPPFTSADVPFLSAVAGVISLAVSRTQHVERLTRFADEDPLTRIPNRRVLERRLHELLEEGGAGDIEVGLLMLDVDGLKDVNDEWGHPEGDALLVRVADVLSRVAMTRSGAWPARLGGDEFCIAVLGTHGVEDLLNRVRVRLADGPPPQPRLSAGFAAIRPGSAPVSELLRRADAAQY
ncbi:MAG: EAL domain-containing protein, partial [Nitriliruptor sp.]